MNSDFKSKIVQLDVGGTLYKVSRDTLERCEGSMLASLVSGHWKEGNSEEPIFIDRNGLLFQYVLDYLRTNKFHLPLSVSRAAVQEECEYYGIAEGMSCDDVEYDSTYVHGKATEIKAEFMRLAMIKAVEESTKIAQEKGVEAQALVFFIMIEYYKVNPSAGGSHTIGIPYGYRYISDILWVVEDLRRRGFEIQSLPRHPLDKITIARLL